MDAFPAATARQPHQGVLRGTSPITVGTPSLLRAINERTVLDLIHRQGPLSRAQVARVSGLSKPTVSLALTGLLEADLVREVGRSRGERGPSALLYELNPMAGWVVGVDIGRKWVRAAIADIAGTIVARRDEHARVSSAKSLIGQVGAIARRLATAPGAHGAAGEVAYMPIGKGDPRDPSNRRRGAFEEAAAAAGIVRTARRLGMRPPLTPERIFIAARRGNGVAARVVQSEAAMLSLAIATVTPVLDPELVILGGGIGRNGDLLVEPIERELRQLMPFRPRIAVSALGEDAVLRGAVATALEIARDHVFARQPARHAQKAAV